MRPQGRQERRQQANREQLEKSRLNDRRECFQRHTDIGNPTIGTNEALSYISGEAAPPRSRRNIAGAVYAC